MHKVLTLANAAPGQRMSIVGFRTSDETVLRMRELGLSEGGAVRVLRQSDPLICRIEQMRLGLGRSLASGVFVRSMDTADQP